MCLSLKQTYWAARKKSAADCSILFQGPITKYRLDRLE